MSNRVSQGNSLRLEMILLRMFISSAGLTSMSYTTRIPKCQSGKAGERGRRAQNVQKAAGQTARQHSHPQRAAGRLCGTVSPPRSRSALRTRPACVAVASQDRKRKSVHQGATPHKAAAMAEATHRFGGNKLGGVDVAYKKKKKGVKRQGRNDT